MFYNKASDSNKKKQFLELGVTIIVMDQPDMKNLVVLFEILNGKMSVRGKLGHVVQAGVWCLP